MDSRIPIPVQTVLNEYLSLFQNKIPNILEGFYLHGSIALNAYINGSSDIDFVTVVNRTLTEEDAKVISDLHKELNRKYKEIGMDGSYIQVGDVGKKQSEVKGCLKVNEGKTNWGNDDINPITWWVLKNKGITVLGPDIATYNFSVDERVLVNYVLQNMNSYWANRLKTMEKYKTMAFVIPNKLVDEEVEWSITGMLRQFYTLTENDIVSKVDACKFAIHHLPEEFHKVINEAIAIREGSNIRYYNSKKQRIDDTVQCMAYILNHSNSIKDMCHHD
ncbi:aminoglycoside adenylyltransferase domain-containing protein [Lysinibacillus sp. NPDC093692]|uniref:aminoglycoside adenylyltransferase domain-containing protein n=1 Tax=Lysinibacillus sp. NPDC093692 TaxID=3390578 RepID=UPI003D0599D9